MPKSMNVSAKPKRESQSPVASRSKLHNQRLSLVAHPVITHNLEVEKGVLGVWDLSGIYMA